MKDNEKISIFYIISLPLVLILASSVSHVGFTLKGCPLYLYTCIYPLTYLISCLITKKAGLKPALKIMSIALIAQTMIFVLRWSLFNIMSSVLMIYTFLAFLIEQWILIFTYDFLVKVEKDTYFPVFLLILGVSILNTALFGGLIEGFFISLSILPRLAYVVVIPAIIARKK